MINEYGEAGEARANVVDRAADSADRAVEATRRVADNLLDSVSDKVESVRSAISPGIDRVVSPVDDVIDYTIDNPLKALAAAFFVGLLIGRLL